MPRKAVERDGAELWEHGRALRDATHEVASAARVLVDDVEALARTELRERPLLALGAAFAAGWVLGGGLPARATALLGALAGRAAMGMAAARLADLGAAPAPKAAPRSQAARAAEA